MRNTISSIVIFIAAVSTASLAQHNVTVNDTDTSIQVYIRDSAKTFNLPNVEIIGKV
jgi:hypothetical protein